MVYDIFISYKRISKHLANNLYYRLAQRGYRVFFDLEEMERDRFDEQIFKHIKNAQDVIVVLEEGSLKAIENGTYLNDWFCKEVMFALKEKKNILPLLLDGYQMPKASEFPDELKELPFKQAPPFGGLSYFEEYIDKLENKNFLKAQPVDKKEKRSVFKFFSPEDCKVYDAGKLIGELMGKTDVPFYFFVKRKGNYRFKAVNDGTGEEMVVTKYIEIDTEDIIDFVWSKKPEPVPDDKLDKKLEEKKPQPKPHAFNNAISAEKITINLGNFSFKMICVEGGKLEIGATPEQIAFSEPMEHPAHTIEVKTFYISEYPVTQNLYNRVMGYNKSRFKDESEDTPGAHMTPENHNPVETVSLLNAQEFCRRLSNMTNLNFSLPTEEEWEYAARGGQKSQGYIYAGSNDIDEVAWYLDNSGSKTHPVGLKKPNELGIYDMSGNVWEWTETKGHSYQDNTEDLKGTIYVRRGGSWYHNAPSCRVAKRYMSDQNKTTKGLGFRIVMRLPS